MENIDVGSIILINEYLDEAGIPVPQHPFVVIYSQENAVVSDDNQNYNYNCIGIALSSYKRIIDKFQKGLRDHSIVNLYTSEGVKKDCFAKCGTMVYFNESSYKKCGHITVGAASKIKETINYLDFRDEINININNIKKTAFCL